MTPAHQTSRRHRSLIYRFRIATLVIAFLMFEGALGLFTPATYLFRQTVNPAAIDRAAARRFLTSPNFDPILGWDANPIARNHEEGQNYLAQAYGDSHTRGAEVGDDETWQSQYFDITGQRILNLGVNGYGLDQAALKFEKYGEQHHTRYAILALNYQQYRRNPSHYSFYCFGGTVFEHIFRYAFKPIFLPDGNDWDLRLPPCQDANCMIETLRDSSGRLRAFLSMHDQCYQLNERRPFYRFPYTINFLRALAIASQEGSGSPETDNYAFVNQASFELSKYLVTRFTKRCEEIGVQPLILMIVGPEDLPAIARGKRLDARLLDFLRDRRIPFVDSGEFMIRNGGADEDLSMPMGHFNKAGNRLIAEALAESPLLSKQEQ